jgi:hypothetical protein
MMGAPCHKTQMTLLYTGHPFKVVVVLELGLKMYGK